MCQLVPACHTERSISRSMLWEAEEMVARAHEVLQGLESSARAERLSSLKRVKNQIIGNAHRKKAYLEAGAVQRVVKLLTGSDKEDQELVIQSTATLGSFGCLGTPGVQAILETCGLEAILNAMVHATDARVVEAAVRSVKMIYQSDGVPPDPIMQPQVLSCMIQLLRDKQPAVQEAAATVLCRCGRTLEQQTTLTQAGIIPALLELLPTTSAPTRIKALELLCTVLASNPTGATQLLQLPDGLDQLQTLLRTTCPHTRLLAASSIAHLATACSHTSPATASAPTDASGSASSNSNTAPIRPIALKQSSVPVPGRDGSSSALAGSSVLLAAASGACRVGNTARMSSAACMAWPAQPIHSSSPAMTAAVQSGAAGAAASANTDATQPEQMNELLQRVTTARRAALPVALRLLGHASAGHLAPATLATLMEDDEELQQAAADADAVRQLCSLLTQPPASASSADPTEAGNNLVAREGALKSLGFLCMSREEARKQLTEPRVLSEVQASLSDTRSSGIRAAAALCITALSRNVRTLRCNVLGDDIARALTQLLTDECALVQVNAAAALCNLVLEFSSVKDAVLQTGVLDRLAANTGSPLPLLRLYSCWALRNLAHKRDQATKQAIMQALGWPRMRSLLSDVNEGVQEQAVCTLRNLCMDSPDHITAAFQWGGSDMLVALEEKLDPCRQVGSQLRVHALYTIVNSLTGSDATKDEIMSSNLPALLLNHMRHSPDAEVRLAAVWCIINLTWSPPATDASTPARPATTSSATATPPPAAATAAAPAANGGSAGSAVDNRLKRLRALGAQNSLQALLADPNQDVRERARTALENMKGPQAT